MTPRRLLLAALLLAVLAPARSDAAALMAAYDRYEPGKGFQIGLVNVSTGATIALPPTVNTNADELHPAISTNGRFVWFVRTQLTPGLSGDVVPPADRDLFRFDRTTGEVEAAGLNTLGYGVTFNDFGFPALTFGFRPIELAQGGKAYGSSRAVDASGAADGTAVALSAPEFVTTGTVVETTHTARDFAGQGAARYMVAASSFDANGMRVQTGFRVQTFGAATPSVHVQSDANHPTPRPGDRHIAYQSGFGTRADIKSFNFPAAPGLTAAAPVSTPNVYEGMPAWSPGDGKTLAFVRVVGGRRQLIAFDTTPGIQDALNEPIDLGPEAPTAGLRVYHETFGGLALGQLPQTLPSFQPCAACVAAGADRVRLIPGLTAKSAVGIFVARVNGTRALLGRKVPRITPVGRVPLGRARKGRTTFDWDGRVEGKRLAKGSYLLTFRALKGERVTATSGSVRFKVGKNGAPKGFKPLG